MKYVPAPRTTGGAGGVGALKLPIEVDFHGREWGVPITQDRSLFDLLILESAPAGLSLCTIFNKCTGY